MKNLSHNVNNHTLNRQQSSLVEKSIPFFGTVNIENILPEQFSIINDIMKATVNKKIKWKSEAFILVLLKTFLNKNMEIVYKSSYKNFNIILKSNLKGKITVKVTKKLIKKVVVDTFINPILKQDLKYCKETCKTLYNLHRLVRFQVDGELLNYGL